MFTTVKFLLAITAVKNCFLIQHEAFLHGDLTKEMNITLQPRFSSKGETRVYKLNKSLYGLKQASRHWFANRLNHTILQQGFLSPHVRENVRIMWLNN